MRSAMFFPRISMELWSGNNKYFDWNLYLYKKIGLLSLNRFYLTLIANNYIYFFVEQVVGKNLVNGGN